MAITQGMLDPGGVIVCAPYFISGKTGTLTGLAAGDAVASLQNLGRTDVIGGGPVIPVPLRITQIRMKYIPVTLPAGNGVAFEVFKTTVTAQRNAGAGAKTVVPTPRKTVGYNAIVATEVNMFVAAAAAITGGTIVVQGDPFDMMALGGGTTLGGAESVWTPSDLVPLSLEAGEGAEVRATQFSGTGIFLVVFDFLRQ